MEVTWVAILASLFMATGAGLVFVFAVKKNYFKDVENAKYHVFWPDVEELVDSTPPKQSGKEEAEDDDKPEEKQG